MLDILVSVLVGLLVVRESVTLARRIVVWHRGPRVVPAEDIAAAVRAACVREGLDAQAVTGQTDLVVAGKLYPVLHHAAATLGKNPELRTVQDVIDWLAEAPQA